MRRSGWFGFLFGLLALAGLGVAGYSIYQAGYRQGLLETATDVVVPMYGGFPIFGLFFGLIFLFFFFGFLSRVFFGWRRWRGGPPRWSYPGNGEARHPMEKRMSDWHERLHQEDRAQATDDEDDTGSYRRE